MSSTNFAAAQERVLERRRLRDAEARSAFTGQKRVLLSSSSSPYNNHPVTLPKLPYPLSRLSGSGLVLWNTIKGREGTRPAFRVGQVDAELLDEELLGLLKGQVGEALKYFGVGIPPAINFIVIYLLTFSSKKSLKFVKTGLMKSN